MTVAQGKRFDMARDTTVQNLPTGMVSAGLAKDTTVAGIHSQAWSGSGLALDTTLASVESGITATNTQLGEGVAPSVSNTSSGQQILQGPGTTTLITMSGAGRIWAVSVSYSMGSSGGTGANQGYARVMTSGGKTLVIVECVVVGNPASDSNTATLTFPGLSIGSGASIELDVNAGTTITGVVQRGSANVVVSIP